MLCKRVLFITIDRIKQLLKLNSKIFFKISNLRSALWGKRNGICISSVPVTHVGVVSKTVECKESRIGKQPIEVPANVTLTLSGQDLHVKGPLGELAMTYPREVKLDKQESGWYKVNKAMETRRANQMHGLFRYCHLFFFLLSFSSLLQCLNFLNVTVCSFLQ